MSGQVCYVVPPYLLVGIADSDHNEANIRESARHALDSQKTYVAQREARFQALTAPRGLRGQGSQGTRRSIVPDTLLKHISQSKDVDEETRACARSDLEHLQTVHGQWQAVQGLKDSLKQKYLKHGEQEKTEQDEKPKSKCMTYRAVYDAQHDRLQSNLPGKMARAEGEDATKDESVNEAYDSCGVVLKFYNEIFDWKSLDDHNMDIISTVHFGKQYENAFWDPDSEQMVYGDGRDFLTNFTGCIDVIGHEMTHAVTEFTSPLNYSGQSGALNEHVSDVFGTMVKQRMQDEKAKDADWLIGEDCLMRGVKGVALRSMKAPGTAYDDPRFGKDPQPAHMKDYEWTLEDNGGVHLYSGIPNRAFYLAATAFGGYSWEKAGKIWWETMQSGRIASRCNFIQFADVTVEIAEECFDEEAAKIVRKAWTDVGVTRKSHN